MVADKIKKGVWWLFLKIEEPRLIRILQFGLYLTMVVVGSTYLTTTPHLYESVLGAGLANVLGILVTLGGLLGAFAVLPGIWWVERLGVISLWTGLSIYMVVSLTIQVSPLGFGLVTALFLALAIRWMQIKDFQFAPGR